MKYKLLSFCAALGLIFCGAANAGNMPSSSDSKPLSQVSEVTNMPEDTMVYIQGYLINNLGNEMYTFQDNSGTITVEIDDDLLAANSATPNTLVWIAAEVNKDGNVTSLEAEEIQFLPNQASNSASNN